MIALGVRSLGRFRLVGWEHLGGRLPVRALFGGNRPRSTATCQTMFAKEEPRPRADAVQLWAAIAGAHARPQGGQLTSR